MNEDLLNSLVAQQGHFILESGYHTDIWFNLDSLFTEPKVIAPLVAELAARLKEYNVSGICGPLLGGAFLANNIASVLNSRFYFAEPIPDTSSSGLFNTDYRIPTAFLEKISQERIAVVDDMISAGSSVRATVRALTMAGASTVVIGTFALLGGKATEYFSELGIPIEPLVKRDFNLWKPEECPLCKSGLLLSNRI